MIREDRVVNLLSTDMRIGWCRMRFISVGGDVCAVCPSYVVRSVLEGGIGTAIPKRNSYNGHFIYSILDYSSKQG